MAGIGTPHLQFSGAASACARNAKRAQDRRSCDIGARSNRSHGPNDDERHSQPHRQYRPHAVLGLKQVDLLGFSIGGLVAQEIALQAPDLVRHLVLVGTGPRSGESMDTGTPEGNQIFGATYEHPDDLWLRVHFTPSDASQAAGRQFLRRSQIRTEDRDPQVTEKAALAQRAAIAKWGAKREHAWDYLKDIKQPTLVINGSNDVVIYTINSYILQQNLPNAQLDHLSGLGARLSVSISGAVCS